MNHGEIYHWDEAPNKGYSIGWNLKTLIQRGMPGSHPPSTIEELLGQILRLIQESPKEWGGPITLNSLDNYIVQYAEKEKPSKHNFTLQIENFFQCISNKFDVTITLDLIPKLEFEPTEKTQVVLNAVNDVIIDTFREEKATRNALIETLEKIDDIFNQYDEWKEVDLKVF